MMCGDKDMSGRTSGDTVLQETDTTVMLVVETGPVQRFVAVTDTLEIADGTLRGVGILHGDFRP